MAESSTGYLSLSFISIWTLLSVSSCQRLARCMTQRRAFYNTLRMFLHNRDGTRYH